MSEKETGTPRTDAALDLIARQFTGANQDEINRAIISVCREIETELATAQAALKVAREDAELFRFCGRVGYWPWRAHPATTGSKTRWHFSIDTVLWEGPTPRSAILLAMDELNNPNAKVKL